MTRVSVVSFKAECGREADALVGEEEHLERDLDRDERNYGAFRQER